MHYEMTARRADRSLIERMIFVIGEDEVEHFADKFLTRHSEAADVLVTDLEERPILQLGKTRPPPREPAVAPPSLVALGV